MKASHSTDDAYLCAKHEAVRCHSASQRRTAALYQTDDSVGTHASPLASHCAIAAWRLFSSCLCSGPWPGSPSYVSCNLAATVYKSFRPQPVHGLRGLARCAGVSQSPASASPLDLCGRTAITKRKPVRCALACSTRWLSPYDELTRTIEQGRNTSGSCSDHPLNPDPFPSGLLYAAPMSVCCPLKPAALCAVWPAWITQYTQSRLSKRILDVLDSGTQRMRGVCACGGKRSRYESCHRHGAPRAARC
jgi:hypothetical protein